jgi:hypothetical protein
MCTFKNTSTSRLSMQNTSQRTQKLRHYTNGMHICVTILIKNNFCPKDNANKLFAFELYNLVQKM